MYELDRYDDDVVHHIVHDGEEEDDDDVEDEDQHDDFVADETFTDTSVDCRVVLPPPLPWNSIEKRGGVASVFLRTSIAKLVGTALSYAHLPQAAVTMMMMMKMMSPLVDDEGDDQYDYDDWNDREDQDGSDVDDDCEHHDGDGSW